MRSVKTGAFFGALWLLGGCMVPDDSPVAGTKPLATLSGREVVAVCDWARDYLGGYMPNAPESDDGSREAQHRCPPTQEDLWDRSDTVGFVYWEEDGCSDALNGLGEDPCRMTVDEFEAFVRGMADDPCIPQTFEFANCSFTYVPPFED
jgi:hypothetical protein